jgi:ABC-type multidrug transport system fused ATPase/permease subunit
MPLRSHNAPRPVTEDGLPLGKLSRFAQRALRQRVAPVPARALARGLTFRVLTMRPHARLVILAIATASALAGLLGPYFQKQFVDGMLVVRGDGATTAADFARWIVGGFLALLAAQGLAAAVRIVCSREAALVNRFLSQALYEHTLALAYTSRRAHTVGEFVSYYAQDIASAMALVDDLLPMLAMSIIPMIAAPVAVGLYFQLPTLPLASVTIASLGLLFSLSFRQSRYFANFKRLAAERLGIVNEWLQNMRIIRILGWTSAFEARIHAARVRETRNRIDMNTNGSAMNAFAQAAPGLFSATGIATVVFSNVEPSPGELFALLWVLSVFLARPIRATPWNVVVFLDGLTSCRRLSSVFALPTEAEELARLGAFPAARAAAAAPARPGALVVRGLSLTLGGVPLLKDLSLTLAPGELVAVVGEVGVGKSLLLDALLREAPATFARYELDGRDALAESPEDVRARFAFVPQDGFVMSSSLRDNVAFDYDVGPAADAAVTRSLTLAAFDPQGESLVGGLDTELGERGVNLSGGQRQRVSLARAHYSDRPYVLLDDCLSAVDVDTERRLLEALIEGAWKDKTRLLVTHRLSVLPHVDRILFMGKGEILAEGTFDHLMATSAAFREVTQSLAAAKGGAP